MKKDDFPPFRAGFHSVETTPIGLAALRKTRRATRMHGYAITEEALLLYLQLVELGLLEKARDLIEGVESTGRKR